MTLMTDLFEALGGRVKQRQGNAHDQLLAAADAYARGEAVDVVHLEEALHDARLTVDDFRQLCQQRIDRQQHLKTFEGLAAARTADSKLQKQIDAANDRFAQAREQFEKDYSRLRQQQMEHEAVIRRAETSRDWLLNPRHVAGAMSLTYQAALDQQQAAAEEVSRAGQVVRQLRDDIKAEASWIEQLGGEQAASLTATDPEQLRQQAKGLEEPVVAKIAKHKQRKARLENRLAEAEAELKQAEKTQTAADREVDRLQREILKAN